MKSRNIASDVQYRVCRHKNVEGNSHYSVREVFIEGGNIAAVSEEISTPFGTTYEDLIVDFQVMSEALEFPVVNIDQSMIQSGKFILRDVQ